MAFGASVDEGIKDAHDSACRHASGCFACAKLWAFFPKIPARKGLGVQKQVLATSFRTTVHLSSPNRAMQVCDAMHFSNPRCESRDFRALDWTKTKRFVQCDVRCRK